MNNKYIKMVYEYTGDFYYYENIQTFLYAFLPKRYSLNWMIIISEQKRKYENDVFAIAMDCHKFEIHKQLQPAAEHKHPKINAQNE